MHRVELQGFPNWRIPERSQGVLVRLSGILQHHAELGRAAAWTVRGAGKARCLEGGCKAGKGSLSENQPGLISPPNPSGLSQSAGVGGRVRADRAVARRMLLHAHRKCER